MKDIKRISVDLIAFVCLVASLLSSTCVQGFNVGLRGTSCSLSEESFNDPCPSLYDGICDGAHCSCPPGTHEDEALKRCVPGSAPKGGGGKKGAGAKGGGGGSDFDDLPFDYVPGEKAKPKLKPEQPDISEAETSEGHSPPSPPSQPKYPSQPQPQPQPPPAQPNYPSQIDSGSEADSSIGEKAGGGIGGGIGIAVLIGLVYYCCRGEKGKDLMSKLPCIGGKEEGDQGGADYQMQQQQEQQHPNAPEAV